jgi:hypothetical protein
MSISMRASTSAPPFVFATIANGISLPPAGFFSAQLVANGQWRE